MQINERGAYYGTYSPKAWSLEGPKQPNISSATNDSYLTPHPKFLASGGFLIFI